MLLQAEALLPAQPRHRCARHQRLDPGILDRLGGHLDLLGPPLGVDDAGGRQALDGVHERTCERLRRRSQHGLVQTIGSGRQQRLVDQGLDPLDQDGAKDLDPRSRAKLLAGEFDAHAPGHEQVDDALSGRAARHHMH